MNFKKTIAKTRKLFLEATGLSMKDIKPVLLDLGIKDNSLQLHFFFESLFRTYSFSLLKNFFLDTSEKIQKGILSFRLFKYPVEEFYKSLGVFAKESKQIYRKIKRYPVKENKCPKCGKEVQIGNPRCPNCKTFLEWL